MIPWWGWIILGVVVWFGLIYSAIFLTAFSTIRKARKNIRKGW